MNYKRLYEFRFRDVDQGNREEVWKEISAYLHERLERPERVLDPAAGRCEFINTIPAKERVAIDLERHSHAASGVELIVADVLEADLPQDHFDAVFISNFLEHLHSQEQVAEFLERMRETTRPGGLVAVMGPNFRYCSREYFDMADHTVVLTHKAVEEHLYAAGFDPVSTTPRFLPYSFGGALPTGAALVRLYLRFPLAWRLLGKQFLVLGRRPAA
jgi:SAM-dependent methyltransferase